MRLYEWGGGMVIGTGRRRRWGRGKRGKEREMGNKAVCVTALL